MNGMHACGVCGGEQATVHADVPLTTPQPYWLSGDQSVAVCDHCGFVFSCSPSGPEDYARYYAELNKHHQRDAKNRALDVAYFEALAAYINTHTLTRGRVLDFGSGALIMAEILQVQGYQAVDNWDVGGATLPGEAYDLALSTHVFEHLYTPMQELSVLHRALKEEGLLVLAVPDVTRYHARYLGPYNYFDLEHINHFSPHTLRLLVEHAGFEVLDVMQTDREIAPAIIYPEVRVIARKQGVEGRDEIHITYETPDALAHYLERSAEDYTRLDAWLNGLPKENNLLGIWGIGAFAMRALVIWQHVPDVCVDSDPRLSGREVHGKPILNKEAFDTYLQAQSQPVHIVVTAVNHRGLKAFIRQTYGDKMTIHCPYEAGVLHESG
ncbi:MAG: class I SAM-dependent methyltransferase [Rickettsiales bacterium]|nr:class I SAM-dependent methyltransferase [Rickettsiales bacterium]